MLCNIHQQNNITSRKNASILNNTQRVDNQSKANQSTRCYIQNTISFQTILNPGYSEIRKTVSLSVLFIKPTLSYQLVTKTRFLYYFILHSIVVSAYNMNQCVEFGFQSRPLYSFLYKYLLKSMNTSLLPNPLQQLVVNSRTVLFLQL